jgi:hypothetical protein
MTDNSCGSPGERDASEPGRALRVRRRPARRGRQARQAVAGSYHGQPSTTLTTRPVISDHPLIHHPRASDQRGSNRRPECPIPHDSAAMRLHTSMLTTTRG